ncbi:MAG: dienelactone hydrolase family protein [Planctomycetia bacterium]|nr:dienelactone hydrolase family protein [Planctomycetia bacterium]
MRHEARCGDLIAACVVIKAVRRSLVCMLSLAALQPAGSMAADSLLDVFPPSVVELPASERGETTITRDYTPSGSVWAEGLDETQVFLTELAHRQGKDDSFSLRVGKGGQIYSLRGPFGESVPPSWRDPRDGRSPWNDEVWQFVAVCSRYNGVESLLRAGAVPDEVQGRFKTSPYRASFFIHNSGAYIPDESAVQSLYCPLLAFEADTDRRTIRTLNWGLVPQVRTIHRSPILFSCQTRDVGEGILELTWVVHNFSTRDDVVFDFLNAPWGGTRLTSLPVHAIGGVDGKPRRRADVFSTDRPDAALDVAQTGGWRVASTREADDAPSLALVFGLDRHLDEERAKAARGEPHCQVGPSLLRDYLAHAPQLYEKLWQDWRTRPENSFRNYDVIEFIPKLRIEPQTTIWFRVFLAVNRRDRAIEQARSLVDKVDYGLLTFDPATTPLVPVHVADGRVVDPVTAQGSPAFELYAKPVPGSLPVFLLEDTATGREVVTTDPYRFVPQEPLDLGVPADHPHRDYYAQVKGISLDRHTTRWKRLLGYGLRTRPAQDGFTPLSSAAGPQLFPAADAYHVDVWVRVQAAVAADAPAAAVPQSVEELWADFDPRRDPLETEVIREWREDGGVFRHVRFLVGTFKGKPARMTAIHGFPEGSASKVPGVMHIHGGGQRGSLSEVAFLVQRGYAALSVNWGGRGTSEGPFNAVEGAQPGDPNTDWGAVDPSQCNAQGYSTLHPGPSQFFEDREHPKNNNWYLLAVGCRRGLTFLEQQAEVDPARLGVHGYSMGGNLTMYVAGTDDRVKVAVPGVGGQGWRWEPHVFSSGTVPPQDHVKGDVDLFRRTISFESYAPRIRCPVMHRSATNDFHGWMDDVYRTNALIQGQPLRYSWTPHFNHRLAPEVAVTMPLWLDQFLKGGPALPETPRATLDLNADDGIPRLTVQSDDHWPVARCEIFYSVDPDSRARFWRSADVVREGETFTAALPLESAARPLFAFANVYHTLPEPMSMKALPGNGDLVREVCLSSEIRSATPAELAAAGVREQPVAVRAGNPSASLLIDDFSHGWRDWYRLNVGNPIHWQHCTRKITDPAWRGAENATLAITLSMPRTNTLTVVVVENEWRSERGRRRTFTCTREVPGSAEPQSLVFTPADFVSTDEKLGPFTSWAELDVLGVCGFHADGKPARKPSWEGAPPEFKRVEWVTALGR